MTLIVVGLAWLAGILTGLVDGAVVGLALPALLAGGAAILAPPGSVARLAALALAAGLLGALRAGGATPTPDGGPLTPYRERTVTLVGALAEPPRCQLGGCSFVLETEQAELDGVARPLRARVLVRTRPLDGLGYERAVQVRGRLEAPRSAPSFPRAALLARRGIYEVLDYPRVHFGPPVEPSTAARLEAARAALERSLVGRIPGSEGQLAAGLLLGRDVALASEVRAQLRATGTSHILAVSGFNVAVVGGVALAASERLLARRWALLAAAAAVATYTLLVGAPPSAVRAALMFGAATLAATVGRRPDGPTALVATAALMLAIDPALGLDLGFQLSFAATTGLVLLGAALTPRWRRLPRWLASGVGVALAAELATLPLVLHVFHAASLVAPIVNVLVAPALPLLMALAGPLLLVGGLPWLGDGLAAAVWLVAHAVLAMIGWAAGLPVASASTGALPAWGVPALYACLLLPCGVAWLVRRARLADEADWSRLGLATALAGLGLVAALAGGRLEQPAILRAVFFDVAGDGLTLLELSGRRVLVGSAGSPLAVSAVADQLPLFERGIDLLVITRAGERDHDGLAELVRRYPIGQVVEPGWASGPGPARWQSLLAERGVPRLVAAPGSSVDLGERARLILEDLVSDDGEVPALTARVQADGLELRLVGRRTTTPVASDLTTVVRLAPELALTRELSTTLAPAGERVVVLGGRPSAAGSIRQVLLAGGEVAVLTSDGVETRLSGPGCPPEQPCVWR